ncbi:hypothetical protein ACTFIZ_012494 [Dictyostelium cf. discoideum]
MDSRCMVQLNKEGRIIELEGTESNNTCNNPLLLEVSRKGFGPINQNHHPDHYRQHHLNHVHQQIGWYHSKTQRSNIDACSFLGLTKPENPSKTHRGKGELDRRQLITNEQVRLWNKPSNNVEYPIIGSDRDRPIRITDESRNQQIHHSGTGRIRDQLEGFKECTNPPSNSSNLKMSPEDIFRQYQFGNDNSSALDLSGLVSNPDESKLIATSDRVGPQVIQECGPTTVLQELEMDRCACIQHALINQGFDSTIANQISKVGANSSQVALNSNWNHWVRWCKQVGHNCMVFNSARIISFLETKSSSCKYASIRNIWYNLSSTFKSMNIDIEKESKIVDIYLKSKKVGSDQESVKYNSVFDIRLVLNYIKSNLSNNDNMSLFDLTLKLVGLLKICLATRSSDIYKILVPRIDSDAEYIVLSIVAPKESRAKRTIEINLESNQDFALCPVKCIKSYVSRLCLSVSHDSYLIRSPSTHENRLSSQSISKIAVSLLEKSGVNTSIYKAHSFRHSVATFLIDKGVPTEDVLRLGRWSTSLIFNKYYNKSKKITNVLSFNI